MFVVHAACLEEDKTGTGVNKNLLSKTTLIFFNLKKSFEVFAWVCQAESLRLSIHVSCVMNDIYHKLHDMNLSIQ
jgi:hypothetical protein